MNDLDVRNALKNGIYDNSTIIDLSFQNLNDVFVLDFMEFLKKESFQQLILVGNHSAIINRDQLKNLTSQMAEKVIWMNGSVLDCKGYAKKFLLIGINIKQLVKDHENFFEKKYGDRVEKLATSALKQYWPDDLIAAKRGHLDPCIIFVWHYYNQQLYDHCIEWIILSIERGAIEMILMLNECKEKLNKMCNR